MRLEDCKPSSQANPPSISDIQDQIRSTCEDIVRFCSQSTDKTFYPVNSGSESWTGIGVVTGFGAVVLMI
jgi:hypothetical protein